ncbi:MAG: hypothetical protein JF609_09645, partial [Verrucomicrobia bacterium]|nr:hypothetical protein [Verrucomicrobiota bacterium]
AQLADQVAHQDDRQRRRQADGVERRPQHQVVPQPIADRPDDHAPGKALVGWAQPYWFETDQPLQTNHWEEAMAAVEADRVATELLKQAAVFPVIDFHLNYDDGFQLALPHLAPLKHAALSLCAAADCDLYNHDPAGAATNICILLALIQAQQNERIEISQLVRVAMSTIAMNATWELLQAPNLTDSELESLQTRWRQLNFFSGAEGAMVVQRAWQDKIIEVVRKSPAECEKLTGMSLTDGSSWSFSSSGDLMEDVQNFGRSGWGAGRDYVGLAMWRNSWSYEDEQEMLQKIQIEIDALRAAHTNQVYGPVFEAAGKQVAALSLPSSASMREWRRLFSEMFFGHSSLQRFASAETAKHMIGTAISLKRFQIRYGRLPASLVELAPEFLATAPLDPMDGKPLRYRANQDGTFLLYSVGADGKDDGGDATPAKPPSYSKTPAWNWLLGHDWVWPQPATADEIQSYYDDHAAKAAKATADAAAQAAAEASENSALPPPPPVPAGTN